MTRIYYKITIIPLFLSFFVTHLKRGNVIFCFILFANVIFSVVGITVNINYIKSL